MWLVCYFVLGFFLLFPVLGWLLSRWNEIWYVHPIQSKLSPSIKIPPGTMGLPLLGEYLTYLWYFHVLCRPDDFINSKAKKYPDNAGIFRSYLFGIPTIIVCNPSLCKLVLHSTDDFKHEWPTSEVLGANSVISIDGVQHDAIKCLIMSVLNRPNALATMVLQIQPLVITALKSWSEQTKVQVNNETRKVTLQLIGKYFPSIEFDPSKLDVMVKCLFGMVKGTRAQPWKIPGTTYHHALKCRKKLIEILREGLETLKHKQKTRNMETIDLMDRLMQMKDKQGNNLTDEEVLDNVFNVLEAGCLAVGYLFTWSFYFLAKSPQVLKKLREENMEINREKNGGFISYEDISKLIYTSKVVEEVIRLGNLVPFVFWRAKADNTYEGYLIPKDWQVILWIRNLHSNPSYFEDPMQFNPDRWDARPKYGTYLPFGGGQRSCPGSTFARVALTIFLHYLSISYEWELLNPDTPIIYLPHPEPDCLEISLNKITI